MGMDEGDGEAVGDEGASDGEPVASTEERGGRRSKADESHIAMGVKGGEEMELMEAGRMRRRTVVVMHKGSL